MRQQVKWRRTRRRLIAREVKDTYPTPEALSARGLYGPQEQVDPLTAPSEAEPRAVRCRQCSAPIEDADRVSTCWYCGSDNFIGTVFGPVNL